MRVIYLIQFLSTSYVALASYKSTLKQISFITKNGFNFLCNNSNRCYYISEYRIFLPKLLQPKIQGCLDDEYRIDEKACQPCENGLHKTYSYVNSKQTYTEDVYNSELIKCGTCLHGGYYCKENSNDPQLCPATSYCPAGITVSKPCPSGFYCPIGTISPIYCHAGYYCPNRSSKPQLCPAGSYCTAGTDVSKSCPSGYYCPESSSKPNKCPLGSYCPPGIAAAIQCPSGYYCPEGTAISIPCPTGFYCKNGCSKPCPVGTVCP